MKRFFVLSIPLIALSVGHSATHEESCQKLAKAFKHYDLKVKDAFIQNVENTCNENILMGSMKKKGDDLKKLIEENTQLVNEYACQSLSDIDQVLTQAYNEFEVIQGLKKLRSDLKLNKEKLSKVKKKKDVFFHAKNFTQGLQVAREIELILDKDNPTLEFIKEIATGEIPLTKENAQKKIKETCRKSYNSSKKICRNSDQLNLSLDTLTALQKMIESNPNDDKLTKWLSALAIKKEIDGEDVETSFSEIYDILKSRLSNEGNDTLEKNIYLSPTQIQAIRSLPNFDEGDIFDFRQMKLDAEKIALFYDYNKHLEDLKTRQELELTHKFTQLTESIKQNLPVGTAQKIFDTILKDDCKTLEITKIKACLSSLNLETISSTDDINDTQKKYLTDALKGMKISSDYISNIEKIQTNCFVGTRNIASRTDISQVAADLTVDKIPECAKELLGHNLTQKETELGKKIKVLEALKREVIEKNKQDLEIRDFAQFNLQTQCKGILQIGTIQSDVKCEAKTSHLSPQVEFLSYAVKDVNQFLKHEVFSQGEAFKSVCQNISVFPFKGDICYIKPEEVAEDKKKKEEVTPDTDPSNLTTSAPEGNYNSPSQDALAGGLGNMMGTLANSIFAPKPNYSYFPPSSPYGYQSPYGYGYPMMSFSDQLLFGARTYGGYGYYMPTPGLRPYSSLSPASTSLYFSSP